MIVKIKRKRKILKIFRYKRRFLRYIELPPSRKKVVFVVLPAITTTTTTTTKNFNEFISLLSYDRSLLILLQVDEYYESERARERERDKSTMKW